MREVEALLARDDVRLLTLTGAGGSGKTRLALQAAAAAADEYPHGVWWVPLAAVSDADGVAPAAANALGGGGSLAEMVADRRLLLLLDNFEHVIDAAPDVSALLATCPRLDVLVTSRERLRVQGEQTYSVPVLSRADARQLFVARARAARSDFEPDEHVDDLCARLDDLPLALELAAARTPLLSTEQLLDRLGSRLDLRGGRDAETRQRTLRATIEWSYDLLGPDERRLLAALSIFRGGWTIEAVERVCDADVELLESLADKSLIRRRWDADRFGMLETIREFAAGRLADDERDRLLRRLLEHLVDLSQRANLYQEAVGDHRPELVGREHANIDVAVAWALEAGEIELALRLLWLLEIMLSSHDPLTLHRWIAALLARAPEDLDTALRALAVRGLGSAYDMSGQSDLAELEYERARALFVEIGDDDSAAHLTNRIAVSALQQGDIERAGRLAAEALELDRRRGYRRDEAIALNVLGIVANAQGRRDEGVQLMYESAAVAEQVGFTWWRGVTLATVADWLVEGGEVERAGEALREALEVIRTVGDRVNTPSILATAALVAAHGGDAYRAGTLWGAVEAMEERQPTPAFAPDRPKHEESLAVAAGREFDRGREHGRALSVEEAFDCALGQS